MPVRTTEMDWLKDQSIGFYEAGIYAVIRRLNITIERNDEKLGSNQLHFDAWYTFLSQ